MRVINNKKYSNQMISWKTLNIANLMFLFSTSFLYFRLNSRLTALLSSWGEQKLDLFIAIFLSIQVILYNIVSIIEQLGRTKIRFVHCYLPQHTGNVIQHCQHYWAVGKNKIRFVHCYLPQHTGNVIPHCQHYWAVGKNKN